MCEGAIVNFAKALDKRAPAYAGKQILALNDKRRYADAADLCMTITFGRYEEDSDLLFDLTVVCWFVSGLQPTFFKRQLYNDKSRFVRTYRRDELPLKQQELKRWCRHVMNNESEVLVETRKFCKEVVAKITDIEDQHRRHALIKILVQQMKLEFVPKGTTISCSSPEGKLVKFVALGSVGLYHYALNEFFPFDVLLRGGLFGVCHGIILCRGGEVAKANTDCFLLEMESVEFDSILESYPDLRSMLAADSARCIKE